MNVSEANQPPETLEKFRWRPILARRLMRTLLYLMIPAVLAASYYAIAEGDYLYVPVYFILFIAVTVITYWNRVTDDVRIIGLMILLYLAALIDYATEGRGSLAALLLATFSFSGALFFGRRGILTTLIISILTMLVFAAAYTTGRLPDYLVSSKVLPGWISNGMIIIFMLAYISFSINFVINEMASLLQTSHKLGQALETERIGLEKTVLERTSAAEAARLEAETARQEVETQMWQAIGQAQLAERMRGEQSTVMLANRVISFLCQYLKAQTGLLYLTAGEKLVLAGGYAFTERPGFKETLEFGEGLVGQAAKTGEMLLLDDIPPDVMLIASGLGEARPQQVLVMPLSRDSQVAGVVEMATLTQFSPQQLAFLAQSAESIATGLLVGQTRQQIADLLNDTQRQASELRAREEELRALNEELQAQADNTASTRSARARK